MKPEDRNLVAFFILAFLWSWILWSPAVLGAQELADLPRQSRHVAPFGPTVAAFTLAFLNQGRSGVIRLAKRGADFAFAKRWLIPVFCLFPAINGGILLVGWLTGESLPAFPWTGQLVSIPFVFVFILILAGPFQEEFGWRGFALDRLQARWNTFSASLILGVIWAGWHLPLFLFSETVYYRPENFWGFVLSIILVTVLLTWIYNNTDGSLLATLLFHASFNFSHWAFPVLEVEFSRSLILIALVGVTAVIVALWGPTTLVRGRNREWLHDRLHAQWTQ